MTWKNLCVKHDYNRRPSEIAHISGLRDQRPSISENGHSNSFPAAPNVSPTQITGSRSFDGSMPPSSSLQQRPRLKTYKSHFKQRYLVEAAWRNGGNSVTRNITQEGGVVTSLHLTSKYIIVALDNAKIHVFDAQGDALRTLQGHVMGVWAMVPWNDTLVSGGCDRDVRVWNLTTGYVYFLVDFCDAC